jgi:hypothetical protein
LANFEASIDQKYGKSLLLAWSFSSAISGPGVGPSPLYMGYSRKVEGSSFPMVVVSDRTNHFIARNLNLKIGFFQTKNRRYWTTRWDNPTKISGSIDLLEVYQMVYLNFYKKKFFDVFLGKFNFQGVSTWSNFGGCSAETAPPKNSNTLDLFYSRMDLSIAIIKLGSNFLTFPTTVRFL